MTNDHPSALRRSAVLAVAPFDVLTRVAQDLERRGAHRIWTTELPGRDAVLRAMHIGAATSTVHLGTGIAYAPTRHPVLAASSAHEANLATGGRFTLGIGTGATPVRQAIGAEFDHPGVRLAEYVALVKAALTARDGLEFKGRFYNVSFPELRLGTIGEPPKVIASGLNPAALKAVARTADGIALHPLALLQPYLDDVVLPAVASGQGANTPELLAWCVTSVDHDRAAARERARARLALYLANPGFARLLVGHRWESAGERIRAAAAAGHRPDWSDISGLVPDDLLDELALSGSPDEVRDQLTAMESRLAGRGITEIALQVPGMGESPAELDDQLGGIGDVLARPA
ncbi:LLM class flavin-dependent oxidoreductase [Streptomyces sp. NPDC020996]|uniref:LLM class flavin-dependent oxidoreductase n=1 Tax=Streptomyces sp. NPDC020996 TaxID=3154791 RepID=UPI0033E9F203